MLLRFVPDDGIAVAELKRMTGLPLKGFRTWLTRMSKWWSYVVVSGHVVRPTAGGLKALAVWRPLTSTIEGRWDKRFGKSRMDELREALQAPVRTLCQGYPDYLPILGYELLSKTSDCESGEAPIAAYTLPMLLAKILLAFAMEFESSSGRSLAISANALRLIGKDSLRVRDLPRLAGVSKEAIEMLARRIEESGLGIVQPESSGGRVRLLTLTAAGERVRDAYGPLAQKIEDGWKARLGGVQIERLRELLEGWFERLPAPVRRLYSRDWSLIQKDGERRLRGLNSFRTFRWFYTAEAFPMGAKGMRNASFLAQCSGRVESRGTVRRHADCDETR